MAGLSFGGAMDKRVKLADDKHRQDWQKINDAYEIDSINAMSNRIASMKTPQTPQGQMKPSISQIGNTANTAASNTFNSNYAASSGLASPMQQPVINQPYVNKSMLDETPSLNQGGFIDRVKNKIGVLLPQQINQQQNANSAANQLGGMAGNAAKAIQSRQSRIEEEMKRQGLRKGITNVKDKTGKGSPTKDTVDAKLAEGEAVLNAGAANILGRKSIAELNAKGLQAMGMQGAQPEFKGGKVHAYGGIDFGDPEMMRQAQNMEMQRRMPVMQASPAQVPKPSIASMQRPPIYSVTEMGTPYTREEMAINADRSRTAQAAQAKSASARAAQSATTVPKPSIASRAMGAGGKLLRAAASAPAAGIMAMIESGNAGAAADDADFAPGGRFRQSPKQSIASIEQPPASVPTQPVNGIINTQWTSNDRAAQAKQLDALSKQYVEGPLSGRTTDLSNADFAAQGMGDIAKIVKNGKTTYTNIGNQNKYNNEEAQSRTVAYKAGEKARANSIAEQTATPQDVEKQTGQFALGQSRKIADLQQQYMAEPDQTKRATMADNIGMMTGKERKSAERKGFDATYTETKDIDGNVVKTPIIYSKDTGDEKPFATAQPVKANVGSDRIVANAKRLVAEGKMTRDQANAELKANGYSTI